MHIKFSADCAATKLIQFLNGLYVRRQSEHNLIVLVT
jgi:hypothetical protein